MQLRKSSVVLSVIDAVDFLSDLVEWNARGEAQTLSWDQSRLKEAFGTVLSYMQALFSKQRLKDDVVGQGLQALMALVREVVDRVERSQGKGFATDLLELRNLENFYQQKILPYASKEPLVLEEIDTGVPVTPDVLQEIWKVRQDKEYELFLIRKEDGSAYFSPALLHHIQLVAYFDALFLQISEDQPFAKIELLPDRNCHEAAKQILSRSAALVDAYYKEALKFKQLGFVSSINKALMALMLAANPRNLIPNTTSKSVVGYYQDFQSYLRQAFTSIEYGKLLSGGVERAEHFLHTVLQLSLQLCSHFFLSGHANKEGAALISSLIKEGSRGSVIKSAVAGPLAFWNQLLDQDAALRFYFKQYPNGPLLKTAQSVNRQKGVPGFDPFSQRAVPYQAYTLRSNQLDISVLSLASPTKQKGIAEAEVVEEFRAWLEWMKQQSRHHLLINLQDRTHWREHARCLSLEGLQVKESLTVVTLTKETDFYYQTGSYESEGDADVFLTLCKERLLHEQAGFYFSSPISREALSSFLSVASEMIHVVFFGKKSRLTQQNRRDFIEILYLLLSLKLMELCKVDSVSFTCKDGVDVGAVMQAELFAFMKMLTQGSTWSKVEADRLLEMLYSPALILRGRMIDHDRFERMVSALEVVGGALDLNAQQVVQECSSLYKTPFFKGGIVVE